MAYLLDADVFIRAKNLHYGFDFCPAFWEWLVDHIAAETAKLHAMRSATERTIALLKERRPHRRGRDGPDRSWRCDRMNRVTANPELLRWEGARASVADSPRGI